MQSSPTRARRPEVNGRSKGARRLLVTFSLLLFGILTTIAVGAFLAVVAVFAVFSSDLPPAGDLDEIRFVEESVVYARDGTTELARFTSGERREAVTYDQIPPILLDATTAIEDKNFWTNPGFDPLGIVAAGVDALRGDPRGGSTITQQLVRQRLLESELVQAPGRQVERKLKEIIQSIRVTQEFPGVPGKQQIITAYLNQNFYGNNSYGVLTAAKSYFGVEALSELTIGQAALLAALPQSPTTYDLVRNAIRDGTGRLVVPPDTDIVARRDHILRLLADDPSRRVLTGDELSTEDYLAGQDEEVVIVEQTLPQWTAPHFVWAVREEITGLLCQDAPTCDAIERGGLRITTTLDPDIQATAEKWVKAAAILPQHESPRDYASEIGVTVQPWMRGLRDKDIHNGALIALDYQTGQVIAYVGSADYFAEAGINRKFQPQFDVLGDGWRQPGSAFKPFNYVTGINDRTMTAATMFMDVTTELAPGYIPSNADLLERGPVRLSDALQFSLNIPAVKALAINGVEHVYDMAQRFGMRFMEGAQANAGLAMTLGSLEVHPADLATAYGTLANRGTFVERTTIIHVKDSAGTDVIAPRPPVTGEQVVTPEAAYVMTDILAGNTRPSQNPIWGAFRLFGPEGRGRTSTLKTGTTNDVRDLVAYGYIAPPTDQGRQAGEFALVVGAWVGNSDASPVSRPGNEVFSTDVAAPLWSDFLQEATQDWAINQFARPQGLERADVDAFSGYRPNGFSRAEAQELFIAGTVPPRDDTVVRPMEVVTDGEGNAYLWEEGCPGTPETEGFLDLANVEAQFPPWQAANRAWMERAENGPGDSGGPDPRKPTTVSYFFNGFYQPYGSTWGGAFPPSRSCDEAPSPSPSASASPSASPSGSPSIAPSLTPEPPPATDEPPEPTEPPPPEPTDPPPPPEPTDPPPPDPTDPPPPEPTDPPPPEPTPEAEATSGT